MRGEQTARGRVALSPMSDGPLLCADMRQLAQLTGLRSLAVPGALQLTSGGLLELSALQGITSLDLSYALISAPRGLANVLATSARLRCLCLHGCRHVLLLSNVKGCCRSCAAPCSRHG